MSVPDLDPQILAAMKKLQEAGAPPLEQQTPDEARANFVETVRQQWGSVVDEDSYSVTGGVHDPLQVRAFSDGRWCRQQVQARSCSPRKRV